MPSRIARAKLLGSIASMVGLYSVAHAQEAPAADAAPQSAPATSARNAPSSQPQSVPASNDIIVTATRRQERLADVPVTVTAVTGDQLKNLNITQFQDVQALAPGLVIENRGDQGEVTSLRGISTTVNTGAPPGVVYYFNEAPIQDSLAFQSIYDIGQIEVLRGPQGTLRGVAAPAGSITIGTKRPDLEEIGGYAYGTYTDQTAINLQAAVGMPLIKDVLAIRVAGLYDRNKNGDIYNPATGARSSANTESGRVSLLFRPVDALHILASYQYLQNKNQSLTVVEGPGLGYNGPDIPVGSGRDNIAVQEETTPRKVTGHLASLNAKLDIGNEAVLSYILGYSRSRQFQAGDTGDGDSGNAIPNYSPHQIFDVVVTDWSHELRLDSTGPGRFWDYTVGGFYRRTKSFSDVSSTVFGVPSFLPPTFAPTGPVNTYGFVTATSRGVANDKSIFASNTFHFPTKTDLTFGARRLWTKSNGPTALAFTTVVSGAAFPSPPSIIPDSYNLKAWVYDAKLVQHLDSNKIVYFSYGHGFRGPGNNKYVALPAGFPQVQPEKQDSYEVGFKGAFLNRRINVDLALYQQDIKGFISTVADVPYCTFGNAAPCPGNVTSGSITFNGNARVRGVDLDVSGKVNDHWTLGGTLSYANAKFANAKIPCRPDLNGDGIADNDADFGLRATQPIYFCTSNGPISDVPKWNFTLQSEYDVPLGQAVAYLRGLFVYKGKVKEVSGLHTYAPQPNLNLYLGARGLAPGLEVSMFAKNIFNTRKLTYESSELVSIGFASGYNQVIYTPQREVGVIARFMFGGG